MSTVELSASGCPGTLGEAPSVLLLAYAFPPIQVQMSPVVARLTAGLHQLGFAVDVITADPDASSAPLPRDSGLLDYVDAHCRRVQRLHLGPGRRRPVANYIRPLRHFPDCMGRLHASAFAAVMAAEPSSYTAVLTVAPFHSVNPVMVRVKRSRPDVCWIAHFCDPWADNPLESQRLVRLWNAWREPQTLRSATYVTHTSARALEMVCAAYPFLAPERTRVVPHVYDRSLYPSRAKRVNEKVTLRFLGTLFGRRSPTPLFLALGQLIVRRPGLREAIRVELIGPMDRILADWPAIRDLPAGLVQHRAAVGYLGSLELMYDADLLLVIEADVAATPFVPSKVIDYMGADTPIIGIVPAGGCREILARLGCPSASPDDVPGIADVLETAIDGILGGRSAAWCNEDVRQSFDLKAGTAAFLPLIMEHRPP